MEKISTISWVFDFWIYIMCCYLLALSNFYSNPLVLHKTLCWRCKEMLEEITGGMWLKILLI